MFECSQNGLVLFVLWYRLEDEHRVFHLSVSAMILNPNPKLFLTISHLREWFLQ